MISGGHQMELGRYTEHSTARGESKAIASVVRSVRPMTTEDHAVARAEPLALVAVGGFAGAISRYAVAGVLPGSFPWGTLAVNVLGSFALGVVVSAPVDGTVALIVGTGFCGAFTTFSSFAFETVRLFETGQRRRATATAVGGLVAGLF